MMDYKERYIELLLDIILKIERYESLTINCDENDHQLEFATLLAEKAGLKSDQEANVVVLDRGKVKEVIPFNQQKEIKPVKRQLLLRIDDTESRSWVIDEKSSSLVNSAPLLQRFGLLAPPQLNKPLSPWAVIAVPGPLWAKHLYGSVKELDALWKNFAKILFLDHDNFKEKWEEHLLVLQSRMRAFNRLEVDYFHLKGDGTDLILKGCEMGRWRSGLFVLQDGRTFYPYLMPQRLSLLTDRFSAKGTLTINHPFKLLNDVIEEATFQFFEGEVVTFNAKKGKETLEAVINIDSNSRRISELSLVESENQLTKDRVLSGYLGFDENRYSSIVLGCGDASHIEALGLYDDEQELESLTGCNISLIKNRIPLIDDNFEITAHLEDGEPLQIMNNGMILT